MHRHVGLVRPNQAGRSVEAAGPVMQGADAVPCSSEVVCERSEVDLAASSFRDAPFSPAISFRITEGRV